MTKELSIKELEKEFAIEQDYGTIGGGNSNISRIQPSL